MHNCLPVGARTSKNKGKGNFTDKCKQCKKRETIVHVFTYCKIGNTIWKTYQPVYAKLQPSKKYTYEERLLQIHLQDTSINANTKLLIQTITNYITLEIWMQRNAFKYENKIPNIERSLQTIFTNISYLLKANFKKHKQKNTLHEFQEKFAINNALCHISQNNLIINLPL